MMMMMMMMGVSAVQLGTTAIQWSLGTHAGRATAMVTALTRRAESCVIDRRASVRRASTTLKADTVSDVDLDTTAPPSWVIARVSQSFCL